MADAQLEERLVILAQSGNEDAMDTLLNRYKNVVRAKARTYFLIGADREDIIQEGMIGLYKAVRDFQAEKQASFHSFAELCITRQMITAIKRANSQKHRPLNTYISFSKPMFDTESDGETFVEMREIGNAESPEDLFIHQENALDLEEAMNDLLSKLERMVMELYLSGLSYTEIAEQMNRTPKSIDNALQRIKHKMENYLQNRKINVDI